MPGACTSLNDGELYCRNTCIQLRLFPRTEVYRSSLCGYALRVIEDVEPNTIIAEYLGEVITSAECGKRMREYTESDDFYFAALGSGLMLDAQPMGSIARFANHSCWPNCELQKWTVLGEPRLVIVSSRCVHGQLYSPSSPFFTQLSSVV